MTNKIAAEAWDELVAKVIRRYTNSKDGIAIIQSFIEKAIKQDREGSPSPKPTEATDSLPRVVQASDIDASALADNLSRMVIDYVESDGDWRNGLPEIISRRLRRMDAESRAAQANETVTTESTLPFNPATREAQASERNYREHCEDVYLNDETSKK